MPNLESLAALGDFFWNTPWSSWQCNVPSRKYFDDTKATLQNGWTVAVEEKDNVEELQCICMLGG